MAAKAPRKQLGVARTVTSPSNRGKKPGGGKVAVGGNPAKIWPAPAWQKGIHAFLSSGEGSSGSAESSANSSISSEPDVPMQQVGTSKDVGLSSSGEGSSTCTAGISLLDDDIAQLNSDDEDD